MLQGPSTFLIAILGCGEGEVQCQQVQVAPVRYESRSACLAATDGQLARHTDLAFPVVVAECRAADQPVRIIAANEVSRPGPRPLGVIQTASIRR